MSQSKHRPVPLKRQPAPTTGSSPDSGTAGPFTVQADSVSAGLSAHQSGLTAYTVALAL